MSPRAVWWWVAGLAAGGPDRHATRAQIGIQRAFGDVQLVGDVLGTQPAFPIQRFGRVRRRFSLAGKAFRAASQAPSGPCGRQPRLGALANDLAFEFGQGRKHVKDQSPLGCGGVDRVIEALQADLTGHQVRDDREQMCEGAAEPIEFPDDQDIARAQDLKQLGEDRSFGAGAADDLGVDFGATGLCECVDLQIDRLVLGADACVPHMHGRPSELTVSCAVYSSGGIKRTLFFRTSILDRVYAG